MGLDATTYRETWCDVTEVGSVLSLADPALAELTCRSLDFAWIDLEHGALTVRDAQALALAVQSTGCTAHVRLPSCAYESLPAILDCGVDGVVAPLVESAAQARELVRRLWYPPTGRRGYGPRRAGAYGRTPRFWASPAAHVRCTVQIESPAGVDAAGEIAAVDGVDALVVGCADLSLALRTPLSLDAAPLVDACERVADAAADAGVAFGVAAAGDPGQVAALAHRAQFVLTGADVRFYAAGVDDGVRALRRALEGHGAAA
jgi:4-hydroxy-2-oxoheptanedioate aldolase